MMSRALLVLMLAIGVSVPADAAPKSRPTSARIAKKKQLPKKLQSTVTPPSVPTPKTTLSDQDAAIVMRFFNMFVDLVVAAKGDCSAIAANVNMLMDQNKELLRLMRQANIDKLELPKPMMDKVMARFKEIMPALTKCMNDPDVEAAFKRFDDPKQHEQPPIN